MISYMREITTVRNVAHLERFVYRAAGQLDADAKNARTEAETAHAVLGRDLCITAFAQLTTRRKARA